MHAPLTIVEDHLVLGLPSGPWILDTGSPASIADCPVFFMGFHRQTRRSLGHANIGSIRAQTGVDAVGLLGNDHLGSVDTILDLRHGRAVFDDASEIRDHELVPLLPISGSSLHSVDVHVEGLGTRRMILDTGAKYSYMDTLHGAQTRPLGEAQDFQFTPNGLDKLDVELDEIQVRLGSLRGPIRCATHPAVTHRLRGTGTAGIIGWDILKFGHALLSPRRQLLGTRGT